MKPLAIDLFCGLGGWADGFLAEGYDVIGYDIDPRFAESYPATFIQADVRDLDGREFRGATVIVASPPCDDYSPWDKPASWNPRRRSHFPDHSCVDAVWRIREESGVPTVVENVAGAAYWWGPCVKRVGSRLLWGDVPLLNVSYGRKYDKWRRSQSPMRSALRSKIPLPLARAVARGFLPEGYVNGPTPVRTPAVASAPEAVNAARPLTEEGKA